MTKFFLKSKTVQGIIVTAIPAVMALLEIEWTEDQTSQLNLIMDSALTALGTAWALFGRATADSKLRLR